MSKPVMRPVVATWVQRRSLLVSIASGVLYAVSTILIGFGGPLADDTDTRQMVLGCVSFVLATGLGLVREWAQRWVDRGQVAAAGKLRTAVKFAFLSVATLIAEMQAMTPKARVQHRRVVAQKAVSGLLLLFEDVEGLRAVVYALTSPDVMESLASFGRENQPPGVFRRHPPGEIDRAFEALEHNRSEIVHDITNQPNRRHGLDHGYRTFISVPIVLGNQGYGLLTIDSSEPDSFTDTDVHVCELMAEMLAIAFASCVEQ